MKQPPKGTEEYRAYKRELEYVYANTEHGFLTRLFQSIYTRAKSNEKYRCKGWIPEITKEQLWQLYHKQVKIYGRVCLYCGQALTFNRNKREKTLTEKKYNKLELIYL